MRILILTTFFPPLNSIASLRPYSWAKYWSLKGHDVTVLTMEQPTQPSTDLQFQNPGFRVISVAPPAFFSRFKKQYQEGKKNPEKVSFLKKWAMRLYHYLRYRRGIFHSCRMPDFADLWIPAANRALEKEGMWDLVVSTAGPYAVHVVAEKLKRQKRTRRWIADYRDNWSDNHIYPGLFPFNWIEEKLERKLMRSADCITATSLAFATKMQTRYQKKGEKARIEVIENGFDPHDFAALSLEKVFPADGKFRIVYTGTIYPEKQDPSPFFQAVAEMAEKRLEVVFVGHQLDHLDKLIRHYGIESYVKIAGFVSRDQALRMQRDADLLLFIVWKDLAERGVYSGKIYEYLFSGTEILAIGAEGMEESQSLILESKTGVALHAVSEIKLFLEKKVAASPNKKVSPDPAVLQRYDRRILAHKLLDLMPSIL